MFVFRSGFFGAEVPPRYLRPERTPVDGSVASYRRAMPIHHDTLIAAQYLAGVSGLAAMRHCLTRPSAVRDRLDDVCTIVEHRDEPPYDLQLPVIEYGVDEGYAAWAPAYDGPNPAVTATREVIADLLTAAPPQGTALDAACGTGSNAEQLADRGYEVIGVDASTAMLDVARTKVPDADLREGTLQRLPVDDASVDLVTCTLALTHVDDLRPPLAEMARVLRPGGAVLLVDMHPLVVTFGGAAFFPAPAESGAESGGLQLPFVRNLVQPVQDYVAAAVAAGLTIAECREIPMPDEAIEANPAYPLLPDAVRQAFEGLPFLLAWRLTR
jgi:SAM-dependent methyltransferase